MHREEIQQKKSSASPQLWVLFMQIFVLNLMRTEVQYALWSLFTVKHRDLNGYKFPLASAIIHLGLMLTNVL